MQKSSLGEIEIQTEVRYWLMSCTEEVRSWITWLGSTHYVFWRCPGPPVTWVLRHPQRTECWSVLAFPLSTLSFFRKIKAWGFLRCVFWSPRVASSGLWPLLSTGPHTQKGPHLCSPCLEMPNVSWTRIPEFCVPHFHFSLEPTNWVAGPGLPVKCYWGRKDIHHPSPYFLIKYISKS